MATPTFKAQQLWQQQTRYGWCNYSNVKDMYYEILFYHIIILAYSCMDILNSKLLSHFSFIFILYWII